ncbi:hypothetical protein [Pseudaminobacter soli (ex Li et al. 2025)]|uniref:hypothetical protein n=1 Tax=Pseudaminobacter soli (ex Li et al. 2025) TaxID=1295366 RepID=UPI001FE08C96|nr:hypothetical protein [Mesorhizobium soli]
MKEGFGRLTVEAAKSCVGKPTIYRWGNASELAMAALMVNASSNGVSGGATFAEKLSAQMRSLVATVATTRGRQIAPRRRRVFYRREELAQWSSSVDRHLQQLLAEGYLTKLSTGVYHRPKTDGVREGSGRR